MNQFDVVIMGGGAAGLMCAIAAGQRGRRVVVLEGSNKVGKKILMSGGGRCNFTNLYCEPANFLSQNPNFCISALSRYTQWDFIALVDKHNIAWHEKTLGQLFCDNSSKQIVAMLMQECSDAGVRVLTDCKITGVERETQFLVHSNLGDFTGESLVIATGGLSIPKMGASDFGYKLAKQFGHNVLPTRAGLVPFTFTGEAQAMMQRLSGLSIDVMLSNTRASFAEGLLFTHRGLSGPAALQISSYWQPGETVLADLLPGQNLHEIMLSAKTEQPRLALRTLLSNLLPRALVLELQSLVFDSVNETPLGEIPNQQLAQIHQELQRFTFKPAATEGYRTAEVTLGGVDTRELSSKTMESQHQAGLYCIGEVVDVTGHLGGFNFQWAWASAQAAGRFA